MSSSAQETTIQLFVEALDKGGYVATSPDIPGLVAQGRTMAETVEIAQGLARKFLESCLEHGDPIPPALSGLKNGSEHVELRIPVAIP